MMNRRLAQLSLFVAVMMAAGCAQMSNVTTGEVVLKNRLAVQVDRPWNQFERGLADNTMTWTQDGVTVDALRFYIGLKDGEQRWSRKTEHADKWKSCSDGRG
jgi:hypothetical protein